MKINKYKWILNAGAWMLVAGCWLLINSFTPGNSGGELKVMISNINPVEGDLYIAVYDSEEVYMEEEKTAFRKIIAVESEPQLIVFHDIPDGEYAISVFQDLNNNAELDTRGIGFPAEPFGFSNNARGRFGPPSYNKTKFTVNGTTEIDIILVNSKKKN